MAAPKARDGLKRAIEEFVLPRMAVIVSVFSIIVLLGEMEARLAFIGYSIYKMTELINKSKYWNQAYTWGFSGAGFLFIWLPGAALLLFDPQTAWLIAGIELLTLYYIYFE